MLHFHSVLFNSFHYNSVHWEKPQGVTLYKRLYESDHSASETITLSIKIWFKQCFTRENRTVKTSRDESVLVRARSARGGCVQLVSGVCDFDNGRLRASGLQTASWSEMLQVANAPTWRAGYFTESTSEQKRGLVTFTTRFKRWMKYVIQCWLIKWTAILYYVNIVY